MTSTTVLSRADLVRRAADLVPLLRTHARWSEQHRRLHDETIEALADAGVFRLRVPARFGGYEADTATLHDVLTQLGRGDGAVAWTASVWTIPGWMVGMFPDEVQQEVYATPDVRVCGTLSPTATGTPVPGGLKLNGRWGFISGALHSHWQEVIAMAPTPDGAGQWPVVALVPIGDLELADDWDTAGLRGSGSVTTVARDVFVPRERIVPLPAVLAGRSASAANTELAMYRSPLLGVANASSMGTVIGLAQAARETFLDRLPTRKIAYTAYERQADASITHLQLADATLKIDEAQFHASRVTALVDEGRGGDGWTLEERARCRADMGAICRLGKEAVDLLALASGGSSLNLSNLMQRVVRDVYAVNLHALMVPSTNFELYGRVLCGLEPNSPYI
ncbi:acyl-CoA dehydrogenase family protein [Actinoplanes teichomyceticus]|uniref:Alkylation response protein AidB-like acyl-CoA dehydrogenase n=1 Tax=Actinoplanes teichomyceticus TaxID=1867 RepID=A0A561WBV7_ACTTI|nr:acyl-CoA dehydrogenase family protein [Actinoplanes teichomyceticus]TWG21344.1 alkylation response protein AidB-like acyl-CoA dehydrogenase [Actinoplanes teichomyceticus]GIF16429.1 acyl-CoA dehydrogenase [Actinoplanes teichomyceticus]